MSICDCTVQSAGTGMTIPTASCTIGPTKFEPAARRRAWIYFNNDYEGFAPKNALTMRGLLVDRSK